MATAAATTSFSSSARRWMRCASAAASRMIDWASWDAYVWPQFDQPDFSLQSIIDGKHDKYIRRWAKEARRVGPSFLCAL